MEPSDNETDSILQALSKQPEADVTTDAGRITFTEFAQACDLLKPLEYGEEYEG